MLAVGLAFFNLLIRQALLWLAIMLGANGAWALEQQYGFNWQIGSQWQHDDNLFLKPDAYKKSDSVLGGFLKADYRKRYSLQTFVFNAKLTNYHYATFDYLDYLGKDLDGTWLWAVTPDITGSLSSQRQQGLNSFVDYDSSKRNLRIERKDALDVRWRLTGGWHLAAGGSQTAARNTFNGERFNEGDYTSNTLEYGGMYAFPSQSQITLVQMSEDGEYRGRKLNTINLTDSGFRQTNQELRLDYRLTGKSKLNIKFGYLNREHDHFNQRDYQGTYGTVDYQWSNGGKFMLNFIAKQDYTSFQSNPDRDIFDASLGGNYYNSSYARSQLISLAPTWQLADKIIVRGKLQQEERDYIGGILANTLLAQRQDQLHQASLSIDWTPRDVIGVSLRLFRQDRDSNLPGADFASNSVGLSVGLGF